MHHKVAEKSIKEITAGYEREIGTGPLRQGYQRTCKASSFFVPDSMF